MSLLVNLSQTRRLFFRASIMVAILVFSIFLFNAIAATPVHIDEIDKPAYVQLEYSFSTNANYYPEFLDELVTNRPSPWQVGVPYTNVLTSATTGVMFVSAPALPDDEAFYQIVSTDSKLKPTIYPAGVTVCPAKKTTCPATITTCAAAPTFCPAVAATTCPKALTMCVAVAKTQCPVNNTVGSPWGLSTAKPLP